MKAFWRFLTSRWTLSFIGTALLCGLVWFLGPLLAFLDSWIVRAAVIAAVALVWLVANLLLDRARRRADQALAEGVAAISPPIPRGRRKWRACARNSPRRCRYCAKPAAHAAIFTNSPGM